MGINNTLSILPKGENIKDILDRMRIIKRDNTVVAKGAKYLWLFIKKPPWKIPWI